jgi:hypothetical protein
MGVQLIRLYDWEPRNDHRKFLDLCQKLGLKVLVGVSNYFLQPGQGYGNMTSHIPNLIRSFAAGGNNYHLAIVGITFGNELEGYDETQLGPFTAKWIELEDKQFPNFRKLPIGHPVHFGVRPGTEFPCFGFWDALRQKATWWEDLKKSKRLFLAPQTYNSGEYLFRYVAVNKPAYVDLAWEKYSVPILFTEIGYSRMEATNKRRPESEYKKFVREQLTGSLQYATNHPDRLIGACFFQYTDKAWLRSDVDTEGSFGAYKHGAKKTCTINYGAKDFTHTEGKEDFSLDIDLLEPSPLYEAVTSVYK